MKTTRLLVALTAVNVALLASTVASSRHAWARSADLPVLRGRGLEIVDERGRVRASISVLPAGVSARGDSFPETVLLRLSTERGRPSVKISSSERGSGLNFSGPTGTSNTWLTLGAKERATSLELRNEDGARQVVSP